MIERAAPAVSLVQAVDQDILRHVELRKRAPKAGLFSATVPVRPERFGLYDHEIDIRVRLGVATGARAEEDHLLGINRLNDDCRHPQQERIVNPCHTRYPLD
ncbi:MAG: hypothetical protein OXQ89_03860 [Rhodospirillaceae bacterium]|nr:hypothetical protein [Rhodospirillaceae bacterium]